MPAHTKHSRSVFATFWANASYKSFGKPSYFDRGSEDTGLSLSRYGSQSSDQRQQHQQQQHHQHPSSLLQSSSASGDNSRQREPSSRLTAHQLFYIAGSHGIGAMAISGGVNFAIAYAMYTTTDDPIRLFEFPNTLAGDTTVTILLQCVVTWLLEMLLVNSDLRRGKVQPIGFISEPAPTSHRALRWFLLLDLPKTLRHREHSAWRQFLYRGPTQVLRALLVGVVCFVLFFGPCVGVLTAVGVKEGGDWVFASRWAPEVFKLVLGGLLGLVTTPAFAVFWMAKCGWEAGYPGRPSAPFMVQGNESV